MLRILFVLVFIVACTKKDEVAEKRIVFALTSEAKTLDPRYATDANGQRITNLIFNSLVRLGPKLKIQEDAAKTWQYENLTYTFDLYPGLKFSNGDMVTEEDILFTFEQYRRDNVPFKKSLSVIESVKADFSDIENPKVILELSEFSATLLEDLSVVKILSKKLSDETTNGLVGTGSFVFEKQTPNEIILRARKDHNIVKPKVDSVSFKVIRDESTLFLKTLKGEIDIVQSDMPANKVENFLDSEDFYIHKYPGLKMNYLLLNLKDSIFTKEIRQALAYAIDGDSIIKYKLSGLGMPATSILTPGNPFFNSGLEVMGYDLARAKSMIGDLTDEIVIKTSSNSSAVENGKVISNQLNEAGFNTKVQSFEWGTFYGDIKSANFQAAIMRWVGASDPDIYRVAFHSKELPPVGRNRGFYSNEKLDDLLDGGRKIENLDDRIKHYLEVQKIVYDELPVIPLWYNTDVAIVNKRVLNYEPPLNGDFSPLYYVDIK